MPTLDINSLKKHPIGFAAVVAIGAATLASAFWYKLVVEDLRETKVGLVTELQAAKQRASSLETTLATYEGQCTSKLQAAQEHCDKQLSSTIESSKILASSQEKLLDEVQRKDKTLTVMSTQLVNRQATLAQIKQLKDDEKTIGDRITILHAKHQKLAREYGYNKAECAKNDFYSGNICEHASMNKSELESLEREIESTKLRLSQIQQQIVNLQSSSH